MRITESFLRQIIREELSRSFLNEADVISRRRSSSGEVETRVDPAKKPEFTRKQVRSIGDVKTTPDRARLLPPNSPFVAGSDDFHSHYNMGVGEEIVRFKIKNKATGEDAMISSLANYKIDRGSFVVIPELFNLAGINQAEAYGVAEVISEIVNFPNNNSAGREKLSVPLVVLKFPPGQHPDGTNETVPYVGLAFLSKIKEADAALMRSFFISQSKNSPAERRPARAVDPEIERARETNVARDRAREEFGIRRR